MTIHSALAAAPCAASAPPAATPRSEVRAILAKADQDKRVGIAKKTRPGEAFPSKYSPPQGAADAEVWRELRRRASFARTCEIVPAP